MKKVVSRILKDDNYFNRKKETLSFSVPSIEGEVTYGDTLQGSFEIIPDGAEEAEGYIFVSDLRMSVSRQEFGGLAREIFFQYDARGLEEGAVMTGAFQIVSNLGEYELPYRISVSKEVPGSSMGEIRNLFHFTNLAKSCWEEARGLFYSDRFLDILQNMEEDYVPIYHSLLRKDGSDQNLENFLVLAKKKTRICYALDVKEVEMDKPEESTWLEVSVVKEGWGYDQLRISTEGDFLECEKKVLTEDDFLGNVAELNYCVLRENLVMGENKGRIILEDAYNHIELPVTVHCRLEEPYYVSTRQKQLAELMHYYMDFRLGRKARQKWTKESLVIINRMLRSDSDDMDARLYQAQILLMEGRTSEAGQILDRLGLMLEAAEGEDYRKKASSVRPEIKGYYSYLLSLGQRDDDTIQRMSAQVEHLYAENPDNWRLAWILLYLRADFVDQDEKKWEFIKAQYAYGLGSPVMFLEAFQIMMRSPSVMTELTEFEVAFLRFVSRKGVFHREIRSRFIFLAAKLKAFSEDVYELLEECYRQEARNDTLEGICTVLMKGNKIGKEYFTWYEKAVEQELRINRLYEYYMMSIDLSYEGKLPKMVLMYFAYRSNLDYERNAYLYVNILKHQQEYKELYQEYLPVIEEFAGEQLLKGRIDENLAYLYENVLGAQLEQPDFATAYLELCFTSRVVSSSEAMAAVVVVNRYLKEEAVYPLSQGEALISFAGDSDTIGLEDEDGNRYFDDSLYWMEPVLRHRQFLEEVLPFADLTVPNALYQALHSTGRVSVSKENEEAVRWLAAQEEITEEYRRRLQMLLLDYYFETDEIAGANKILETLNPSELNAVQREDCLHILVAGGKYEQAMEWIRTFGTEAVNDKILLRLCDRMLSRTDYAYDAEILKICLEIFAKGKYDEAILKYLLKYAKGSSRFYKQLWRAAESFDLDVQRLLEQMLIQILYSRVSIGEETNIYLEYVEHGAKTDLEAAFLSLLAYQYFNKQEKVDERVFDRVIYLTQIRETVPIGCKLAYLKKTTQVMKRGRLFDAEKELIPVFLKDMAARQIFFPFFMEFRHLAPELEMMSDRCFIEYHGAEGSKVVLHYVTELENDVRREYKKEEMPHMYAGIYVKSFILFSGEKIQYYITEEDGRQEKLTRSSSLAREESISSTAEDRFSMINRMVISRERQDYAAYCKVAEDYAKKSFMVSQLFTPL